MGISSGCVTRQPKCTTAEELEESTSKQYSAAIAFTLALFSHLVSHVHIGRQAELEEGETPVPAFQSDGTDEPESKGHLEKEGLEPLPAAPQEGEARKNQNFSHLSCLCRPPTAGDDSDMSEGFD
ncbi:hypothetical protein EI555_015716 [Monodon monoceros]|uniref:Uncharacterized protein n=1 Tax=Monodon monoceros TaxID=40151 RepID=A0A4U1ES53_MONMO|nr:hypothetical protein EI555_015716 [Monodon monoceros]